MIEHVERLVSTALALICGLTTVGAAAPSLLPWVASTGGALLLSYLGLRLVRRRRFRDAGS